MSVEKTSTGDPSLWRTICISHGELPIGRASARHPERTAKNSNMFFDNSHLSKTHAKLSITNKKLFLEDLSSTFGTVWNSHLLVPYRKVALKEGDRIGLVLNRPSNSIREMTKKANGTEMIALDILLNPSVQLAFSVVSFDADEGSLVLLPLSGENSLADLRKESQAKKKAAADKDIWGDVSDHKYSGPLPKLKSSSPADVSTENDDSGGPPTDESYEREYTRQYHVVPSIKPGLYIEVEEEIPSASGKSSPPSTVEVIESESQDCLQRDKIKSGPKVILSSATPDTENDSMEGKDVELYDDQDSENSDECEGHDSLGKNDGSQDLICLGDYRDTKNTKNYFDPFATSIGTINAGSAFSGCRSLISSESTSKKQQIVENETSNIQSNDIKTADTASSESKEQFLGVRGSEEDKNLVRTAGSPEDQYQEEDSYSDSDEDSFPKFEDDLSNAFDIEHEREVSFDNLDYTSGDDVWSSEDDSVEAVELILNDEASRRSTSPIDLLEIDADLEIPGTEKVLLSSKIFEPPSDSSGSEATKRASFGTLCYSPEPPQPTRKRAHDAIDSSDDPDQKHVGSSEDSGSKKPKTGSIAREVGKGLIYVTGTLIALVAYGGYLESVGLSDV